MGLHSKGRKTDMKTAAKRERKTLRIVELALLLGAAAFLMTGVWALNTQRDLADKVVRLHVLANSDTEEEGEEIRSIKEALLRHSALGAAMSGSGPTVFGLFDDRQKAVRAKEALEGRYRQTYLAAPVKILEKME